MHLSTLDFVLASIFSLVLGAVLFVIVTVLERRTAWLKHWRDFWFMLLLASLVPFLVMLVPTSFDSFSILTLSDIGLLDESFARSATLNSYAISSIKERSFDLSWGDYWMITYGMVVIFSAIRFIERWRRVLAIVNQACTIEKDSDHMSATLYQKLRRLSVRTNTKVVITTAAMSPFVIDFPRRTLVLSQFALSELSSQQLDLLLRHELIHLRRKDAFITWIAELCLLLAWFNPFVFYFRGRLMWSIESSCDHEVLNKRQNLRRIYAHAMLKILRGSATSNSYNSVAAFSSKIHRSITMRINHIMNPTDSGIKSWVKKCCLYGSAMGIASMAVIFHPKLNAEALDNPFNMKKPVADAKVSSNFGTSNKFHKFHKGIDLAAVMNTPITAIAEGKVVLSEEVLKDKPNYGTIIVIDHGNGLKSLYSHLNKRNVKEGDYVMSGQLIGHVGQTGRATGPHVHLEVLKDGKPVDPRKYINFDA